MPQRSGSRRVTESGLGRRYRTAVVAVLLVGLMITGSVAATAGLGGQGVAAAASADGMQVDGAQADATVIDSCTVVDEPGRYVLTGDVDGAADDACLHVRSDDVVIDGSGHALRGNGTESGVGILVFNGSREGSPREGSALGNVTVRDVEVSNWGRGLQAGETLDSGPTMTLRNVSVTDNGRGMALFGVDESEITDLDVSDNERGGMVLWETDNMTATNVTASGNGASGIAFSDVVSDSTFTDVTVADNNGHGIHFSTVAVDNEFTRAHVANNSGAGLSFADSGENVVRDSTVVGNDGPGVFSHPAGDDRLDNVTVADNEIAYRNDYPGVRYGVLADDLRLDSGVEASFDKNVSSFDGAADVPEPPRNARTAGPAANLTMNDEAADSAQATITFPYADEAVGNESTMNVVRYSDGEWEPVTETNVDRENQTVTATVGESGVYVPVSLDERRSVSANESTVVVSATDDGDEVVYGFVVEGEITPSDQPPLPAESDEEFVAGRSDGTTAALGTTGEDGGDTFVVTGEIVTFATQPQNASVRVERDGEDVTDRLTGDVDDN